jgi:hypothetical protein
MSLAHNAPRSDGQGEEANIMSAIQKELPASDVLQQLIDLWADNNNALDGATRVDAEYLEIIARRD